MVPKVQGFISFFLIFLKSESSPVEGTGDERHVHAPQTRWRLSKPMPEGAHPCFGVESVSPQALQGWLLTLCLAEVEQALVQGSVEDRLFTVKRRWMLVCLRGTAQGHGCESQGLSTSILVCCTDWWNSLGQEWQSPYTVKGTSLPFGSGEEENPPFLSAGGHSCQAIIPPCSLSLKVQPHVLV